MDSAAPQNLGRLVVRGTGFAGAGYAVTQAVSLASYLVLARLLAPAAFGTFAAATVLIGVGLVIGESGLLAALIQRRDRVEEAFHTAFVASVAGGLALSVLGVASAPLIALFFHSYQAGLITAVMAASMLPRTALIVPHALLQRRFSFVRRVTIDPLSTLIGAAAAVIAAARGAGAWALVIGVYAQVLTDLICSWTAVRWRPRPSRASVSTWRELARFGRPVLGANLISHATLQVPVVAVGRVLGAAALGQLSYAIRVGTQPIMAMVDVGGYALLPAFARIAPDDARFRAGVLRTLRWMCALSFPLGMLLVPLGTPAMVLLFGSKWHPAAEAVMALGVYCAVSAFEEVANEVFKAAPRPGMILRMRGVWLALTVICVGSLAPLGLVAVTAGMAASALGGAAYAVHGIGKVLGVQRRQVLAGIVGPAVATVLSMGALFVTEHVLLHSDRHGLAAGLGLLALEAIGGLALYLACVLALSASWRHELSVVMRRGGVPAVQTA